MEFEAEGVEGDWEAHEDRVAAVIKTLMMQTIMGFADMMAYVVGGIAERENAITHQALAMGESPILKMLGISDQAIVSEERMKMIHQPGIAWAARIAKDHQKKCAEVSDAWIDGPRHYHAMGMGESEMCQFVRGRGEPARYYADGRVVQPEDQEEDGK